MRILIAGLLGAIAMFVWTSIAHTVTPLGYTGLSQMPNEQAVLNTMHQSIGDKEALYFFPWVDPKDPNAMTKEVDLRKLNPSGMLLYRPPLATPDRMAPLMVKEFLKELAQTLIAAFVVAAMAAGFANRVIAVTLIGVSAGLATNASYWIWYRFPLDYTLAQITIEVVGAFLAGLAIAWWLGRGKAMAHAIR
ncbi:MAG: hypothetical protein HY243_15290 [Proteobacteria bacterium]|nr:hypothetical protein [Pseudomonadota bacterium]